MKTWMKVTLGIFGGFAVLIGLIFWLTGDVTKTGDDFFAAVQNDDMDAAYALLSDDFQAGTSKESLQSYLVANALDNPKDTSWGSRSISGSTGELEGTVTTADGGKISLKLLLVNSEAGWRIHTIEKESARFKDSAGGRSIPSAVKQKQLFQETMTIFAESLSDGTMKKMRDRAAGSFQRQIALKDLDKSYEESFKFAEDFSEMSTFSPIIDSGDIGENGALNIRGHYQNGTRPIYIDQAYEYEGIGWKLMGLVYRVGSP